MCRDECFGNRYRGCGHYVRLYYSGNRTDCNSPTCVFSSAHMHKTATACWCSRTITDDPRILNLLQAKCDPCKEEEEEQSQHQSQHRSRR